jgi:hypothetical protein
MIDATYGHLAPDAEKRERELLDTYDSRKESAEEHDEHPGRPCSAPAP